MNIKIALVALSLLAVSSAGAQEWKLRVAQLDLARQMETVDFVKKYLTFAKESGYNAVQLYLEGRVRTKSFPYRSEAETYSVAEMKEIVAEAQRVGIDLVPVVSVLGHAENFVTCKELDAVCEESRAGGRGRFGRGVLKQTFCHSVPETRKFLERYLDEMVEIFPGKNFHVGLDESFNTGFCPECAAKMKTVGLGGIYLDVIRWAHDYLAKKGRRMWMWDDFFEFFPEKQGELPKDVMLCDWEYSSDISRNRGHYGCFGDRFRKDWIRTFKALGVDSLACPSQANRPMTRFSDYAESAGGAGGIYVLWEMSVGFHGKAMVRARTVGLRWSRGLDALTYDEAMDEAVAQLCPSLNEHDRLAVRALVEGASGAARDLAIARLKRKIPRKVNADPFSEAAILDDIVTECEQASVSAQLAAAEYAMTGLYRRPEAIRAAKARVRALKAEAGCIRVRRAEQEDAWRPNCKPNDMVAPSSGLIAKADKLLAVAEEAAPADEWQLELHFLLPDFHGIPGWTVEGKFDGRWEQLAKGNWKPDSGEWCYFERTVSFRRDKAPTELRISYKGYNDGGLAYVSVANKAGRLVPAKVLETKGRVRDVGNLMEDTVDAALFGNPNCRAAMLDPSIADEVSSVTLSLRPEVQ